MERGWSAKGLLSPLYGRVGGRDKLAKRAGTNGSTLSSINTGNENLGYDLGRRLAAVLGVTLEELGAPADIAHPSPVMAELAEIRAKLEAMDSRRDAFRTRISRQLKTQGELLKLLTDAGVELRGLIADLREASAEDPPPSREQRPA